MSYHSVVELRASQCCVGRSIPRRLIGNDFDVIDIVAAVCGAPQFSKTAIDVRHLLRVVLHYRPFQCYLIQGNESYRYEHENEKYSLS